MNVTLAIDEKIILRARKLAEQRGSSLNQVIRDYLEEFTATTDPARSVARLTALWEEEASTEQWPWNREELYDRAVLR